MRRTINYDYNRLLTDLDFKVKLIEAKLKRQNAPEKIIDRIKKLLFNNASSECYGLYDLYLD